MFGFVRQSKYDALAAELNYCREELGVQLAVRESIMRLCWDAGVTEEHMASRAVQQLVDRVYVAASTVAEKEKLNHYNRGMLAEREAAKTRRNAA